MAGSPLKLMPGEKMVLSDHPHWWYFWKEVTGAAVLIVILILWASWDGWAGSAMKWIAIIGVVVLVIDMVFRYVNWQSTRFAITDQRVAYQSGFLKRRGVSIPLNRVNNVNFEQNFIARLLNNGVVVIESAGETGDSIFENIPDPEHVRNTIFAQVEADEIADSKRSASDLRGAIEGSNLGSPAAATPASSSTADRLQQLAELRDKGLVTPAEFEAKREEIVGDL